MLTNHLTEGRLSLEQASTITQSIVSQLGYPCEIFSSNAQYEEVMDAYEQALRQGKEEGFTPLLVPADEVLEEYLGFIKDDGYSLKDILASELKSGEELLQERIQEYIDDDSELDETELYGEYDGEAEVVD